MMRRLRLLLLLLIPFAIAATSSEEVTPASPDGAIEALAIYDVYGNDLLGSLEEGGTMESVTGLATELIRLSRLVFEAFAAEYPTCGPYFEAVEGVLPLLGEITRDAIERDYHGDGALPEAPSWCYHAKDLLVHPATVIVLAREGDDEATRSRMDAEMREALTHLTIVERMLGPDVR